MEKIEPTTFPKLSKLGGHGELVRSRDLKWDYFENILIDMHFVCKLEYHLKKQTDKQTNNHENRLFLLFLSKNQLLSIFYTQNDHFSIFKGVFTL